MVDSMFALANRLNDNWHIESPANGEKYPKLLFSINIKTNFKWFILDHEAKIIFERFDETEEILEIPCVPCNRLIDRNKKDISFYVSLTPQIYNDIETFRNGEEFQVHLLINKLYLLPFWVENFQKQQDSETSICYYGGRESATLAVKHDVSKLKDLDHRLPILRKQWAEKVIKPYTMTDRFIIEVPYKLSEISEEAPSDTDLKDLRDKLGKGIVKLRKAIEEYDEKRNKEKCITDMREVLDLLYKSPAMRTYKIDFSVGKADEVRLVELYAKYLIEDTETGSKAISNEMMTRLLIIIDQIYMMASKVPHCLTKKREIFEYTPDSEDAQMILGITSLLYYWMSIKFEKAMIK